MFPQARKHCRNGDADTDCDWDNTKGGKIRKTKKAEKARKIQKGKEKRIMRRKGAKKRLKNGGFLKERMKLFKIT
ncbi:MAG: hypothetical protein ACOH2E_05825 [Candidatus Paracaedibacter sp.]